MGAWGVKTFDNDDANDWAYGLDDVEDLSLVESAFEAVEEAEVDELESPEGANALAACEVLARLAGRPGYNDAYTEKVDAWVAAHPQRVPKAMVTRALRAIDKVTSEGSELRDLWDESGSDEWLAAVEDLRRRVRG